MAYVYKDAVYDLLPRRFERVPQLRLRSGTFRNLIRTDFSIRNRVTGWTTEFRITYGTEGALAGVPVHAQYQPNWWFRVELELDEGGDAPADPAGDVSIRQETGNVTGVLGTYTVERPAPGDSGRSHRFDRAASGRTRRAMGFWSTRGYLP